MQRAFPLLAGASGALCGSKSLGGLTHTGPMIGWIDPLRGVDVLEEGFVERCLGYMALESVYLVVCGRLPFRGWPMELRSACPGKRLPKLPPPEGLATSAGWGGSGGPIGTGSRGAREPPVQVVLGRWPGTRVEPGWRGRRPP